MDADVVCTLLSVQREIRRTLVALGYRVSGKVCVLNRFFPTAPHPVPPLDPPVGGIFEREIPKCLY